MIDESVYVMLLFIAYVILSMAVAIAAESIKMDGVLIFFVSYLLTPLTGLIIILLSEPDKIKINGDAENRKQSKQNNLTKGEQS